MKIKMIKSTKKAIVAAVAVVLVALLVAGIVVGIVYFFNSNRYLFRMSALTGEYVNMSYLLCFGEPYYKYVYEFSLNSSSDDAEKENFGCYIQDGECRFDKIDYNGRTSVDKDYFDKNVFEKLEYFAKLFDKKCDVQKDKIVFCQGVEAAIESNEYIPKGEYNVPVRIISCKVNDGTHMEGKMRSIYVDDDGRFVTIDKEIVLTSSADVSSENGQTYNLRVDCRFLNIDFIKVHRLEFTITL